MADPVDIPSLAETVNLPGLIVLGATGIPTMFFIVRWMIKYQREFTAFYIEENNKLRLRIDALEAEVEAKDEKLTEATRAQLKLEQETGRRISTLENAIERHESTITRHEATIARFTAQN